MNKVQFWIEQGLLPYLIKDVPHKIIDRSRSMLKIEMEVNGLTLLNLCYAAKAYGVDSASVVAKEAVNNILSSQSEAA